MSKKMGRMAQILRLCGITESVKLNETLAETRVRSRWGFKLFVQSRGNVTSSITGVLPSGLTLCLSLYRKTGCYHLFSICMLVFPEGTSGCLKSIRRPCTSGTQTSASRERISFLTLFTGKLCRH